MGGLPIDLQKPLWDRRARSQEGVSRGRLGGNEFVRAPPLRERAPVWGATREGLGEGSGPEPGKEWGAGREKTRTLPLLRTQALDCDSFPTSGTERQRAPSPWEQL